MFFYYKMKKIILENTILFFIYKETILKIKRYRVERSYAFLKGNGKISMFSINNVLKDIPKQDFSFNKKTIQDIIDCYLLYGFNVKEYVLFQLYKKNHRQRLEYLSDCCMDRLNMLCVGKNWENVYSELRDKNLFYELTKNYFKRDVLKVSPQIAFDELEKFVAKHRSFIVKPLQGALGGGIRIECMDNYPNLQNLLKQYVGDGVSEWIFEELIEQTPELSAWNHSSINTIRICSFRKGNDFVECWPRIRTGRKGMIVDNAGQGGIVASIDVNTGIISSNGADEFGKSFEKHPDSEKVFLGWQVPLWNELIELSKKIHKSLPKHHKYVAFDFALTPNGWVLIEGNWGQFMGTQMTLNAGLRKDYEKLMLN